MEMFQFPVFTDHVEGAVTIPTTGDEQGVTYMKDIVYSTYGETKLHLQILVPVTRNRPVMEPMPPEMKAKLGIPDIKKDWSYPCLVYVPGSAWAKQNCYGEIPILSEYAKMGYVVAIVEYRDYTIATFPAPIVDARNAVRFLKSHADEFAIDPERMVLAGSSSGGHTASYAGIFHDDEEDTNQYPGVSGEVKGIINYFGCTDFTFPDSNPIIRDHCGPDSPEGKEMGGIDLNQYPELIEKLSVVTNIKEDTDIVPMLIFHGTADFVVNAKCSVNLYNVLKACGKDVSLYLLEGSGHGGNEFHAPEMRRIADEFMKRVIG